MYGVTIRKQGTSVPLQAWNGPEGSKKLRFPDFMKTALEGGKVINLTHRHLPPGKADSHIACRVHAAPMPFHCHAVTLRV